MTTSLGAMPLFQFASDLVRTAEQIKRPGLAPLALVISLERQGAYPAQTLEPAAAAKGDRS